MSATQTELASDSRRVLIGLCLCMGGALVGLASLNYILTPMLADLGIDEQGASLALSIPSIASLLVVFLAGRLGDRRGHRTVIIWMSVSFMLGSAIVAAAQGLTLIVIGLLFQGLASTAIQILVFGMLSERFSEPKARAAAFGTFGMVSPFIWMCFPVLTGWVVGEVSWRWVAVLWVVSGLMILLAAQSLLPRPAEVRPTGEIATPILAGATVAGIVLSLDRLNSDGLNLGTLSAFALTAALAVACGVLMRRLRAPAFSLQPLRTGRTRALLGAVVIIPLINTIFLMTMAFQYLYGLTVLQTAIVMIPAQAAAVLGTRFIAGPLMRRIGATSTASVFFGVLSIAMLCSFFVQVDSPLWVPIVYVAVYNVLTVAASITVTSSVLASDPDVPADELAAYRGSGVALGAVLAVVLMNTAVFSLGRIFMSAELQANGLSQEDAASLMGEIQSSSTSTDIMSQYAAPLPSGLETSQVIAESIAAGLHINGVIGAVLALMCIVLVRVGRRESLSA